MDLGSIAVRCLFAYAFLLLMTRLKGKHVVAEATPFDFVMALVLGDLIDDLLWAEVPASQFIVAAATIIFLDLLSTTMTYRSTLIYRLLAGKPQILMADGRMSQEKLRAEQMHETELESLLRMHGLDSSRYQEVRRGILEVAGELSVLKQPWAREVPRRDVDQLPRVRK